jgi:oxamate amidohydrolase
MSLAPFRGGVAVASHHLAAESAAAILQEGGNAIEAMVAAAATITAVYPHMTSIGGDAFWLIHEPGTQPVGIDACGPAAGRASIAHYREQGVHAVPMRGPLAANTVAGTVSGWKLALDHAHAHWGAGLPLPRLLDDAVGYARNGIEVTQSQHANTTAKLSELAPVAGFGATFLAQGRAPAAGSRFFQPRLAASLEQLARAGLDDFYRGDLGRSIVRDLEAVGSPLALEDLITFEAQFTEPLTLKHSRAQLYNTAPPTQGVISLAILGILDRLRLDRVAPDSADYLHLCVEAAKQAFLRIRDRYVTDPAYMKIDAQSMLDDDVLDVLAASVNRAKAVPWGARTQAGDTVWIGVIDAKGRSVSFIQSIYHEFGSGLVLAESGINWQNRGASFSLDPQALWALEPGKKPFHTLNPALALFDDGRTMPYGTMGGDGQPQTQCAVFTRVALYGMDAQNAINAPRWLLGRTWGKPSDTLKLEQRFPQEVFDELKARGHDVEWVGAMDETMGHAGALIRNPDGTLSGGYDPRSDGAVVGF